MDYKDVEFEERSELLDLVRDVFDVLVQIRDNQQKLLEATCNK